jgi:hypothetical protein
MNDIEMKAWLAIREAGKIMRMMKRFKSTDETRAWLKQELTSGRYAQEEIQYAIDFLDFLKDYLEAKRPDLKGCFGFEGLTVCKPH